MKTDPFSKYFLPVLFFILLRSDALAQTFSGVVVDEHGLTLESVSVCIPALELRTFTKSDGTFAIDQLGEGKYTVEFFRTGLEKISRIIDMPQGDLTVRIALRSSPLELPAVTVTAKPRISGIGTTSQPISVVERKEIAVRRGQSIISTLENVPGIAVLQSGPFGTKPVIRGLSFQRVVVLENGQRHVSQQWDEDDSPGIDPFEADRLEVVRGPSSLLFGSDALGGVVNITTSEMSNQSGEKSPLSGTVALNGFSNNRQAAGNFSLHGSSADFDYRGSLTIRRAGDFSTPDETIKNSGAEEMNGRGSILFRSKSANINISYSKFDQKKYLPSLFTEGDSRENGSYQKTAFRQIQARYLGKTYPATLEIVGNWQSNDASEYDHADSEVPEIRLRLNGINSGLKLHHELSGGISGTIGLSLEKIRNETSGEEPLIPEYDQTNVSCVLFEELSLENLSIAAGIRFDARKIEVEENEGLDLIAQNRKYSAFTGTVGSVWHIDSTLSFALNVGRGWRAPHPQELFVNGLEEGSARYKIGNPELKPEESAGIDISVRYLRPSIQASITGFYHFIDRYIYLGNTGDVDSASGAGKYENRQADAEMRGIEFAAEIGVAENIVLQSSLDIIAGRNEETGSWLPHIPPARLILGFKWSLPASPAVVNPYVSTRTKITMTQNRTGELENRSPGYTIFDLGLGGEIPLGSRTMGIHFSVENILNRSYRDHLSLYREYFPGQGFNAILRIEIPFSIISADDMERN